MNRRSTVLCGGKTIIYSEHSDMELKALVISRLVDASTGLFLPYSICPSCLPGGGGKHLKTDTLQASRNLRRETAEPCGQAELG
jgi:hypothetical protein